MEETDNVTKHCGIVWLEKLYFHTESSRTIEEQKEQPKITIEHSSVTYSEGIVNKADYEYLLCINYMKY